MLVPSRWHRRRLANLVVPLLSLVALREALGSRARNLGSRARNLGSRARNLGSRARNLGSRVRNPVIRVACPNRPAVNRQVGRELLPQLLSFPLGTFR